MCSTPPVLNYVEDQPNNKISNLKLDKSNVGSLYFVYEMLCRVSWPCLGAMVYKERQLCWSSSALPSTGHLRTGHSRLLSSVQTEVPAEAIAGHQKVCAGQIHTIMEVPCYNQVHKFTCPLFEITSTGAALSFLSRIPNNLLLYPPESKPWIKTHVSAMCVSLFFSPSSISSASYETVIITTDQGGNRLLRSLRGTLSAVTMAVVGRVRWGLCMQQYTRWVLKEDHDWGVTSGCQNHGSVTWICQKLWIAHAYWITKNCTLMRFAPVCSLDCCLVNVKQNSFLQ